MAPPVWDQEHERHHAHEQYGQDEKGLGQALHLVTGVDGDGGG